MADASFFICVPKACVWLLRCLNSFSHSFNVNLSIFHQRFFTILHSTVLSFGAEDVLAELLARWHQTHSGSMPSWDNK